jgi:hypothetical protein
MTIPMLRFVRVRGAAGPSRGRRPSAIEVALRVKLTAGGVYMLGESVLHASGIRLTSVQGTWSPAAVKYAGFLETLYASFALCIALLALEAQRSLAGYRRFLYAAGAWACLHGLLLAELAFSPDLLLALDEFPSLHVWIPRYGEYLVFEAVVLWSFSLLVLAWSRSNRHER